jgi:protein-tyrosine phosphatase
MQGRIADQSVGSIVEVSLCFVCLGNICRSPTAEGVMLHLVREAGLEPHLRLDSAGTAAHHAGELPDARARAAAARRGIELGGRARQFRRADWSRFDYVLAMDESNYADLRASAPTADVLKKLHLLRSFDPASPVGAAVPDPYYGGDAGFDQVIELCFAACRPLLDRVRRERGL